MSGELEISVVMICRDAARTLAESLESVAAFPEVVLFDSGSADSTLTIAARFPNVRVHTGSFAGFGHAKNHAVSLASHDWVLSLDADEIITPTLLASIRVADLSDFGVVYQLERRNFMMGRLVRHGGWGNDQLLRLFNRRSARFNDAPVHEKVVPLTGSRIQPLPGYLQHRAADDLGSFLVKINRYSELRRTEGRKYAHPVVVVFKSLWAFLRTYLLQGGCLDGWRGLVIAVANANGVFFRYMKVYADRAVQREKHSGSD